MFADKHLKTGEIGEKLVQADLTNLGWVLIHTNLRSKLGEIDIIAREPHGMLVFIEVKTLRNPSDMRPEDHLTKKKIDKMHILAHTFANSHPHLVHKAGWRVDAVTVILTEIKKIVL